MSGIYFHIPFCKQACHYCDFHFTTSDNYLDKMVASMEAEVLIRKDYLPKETSVKSIYFGGGTPSVLNPKQLAALLDLVHKQFLVDENVEITLEANPDDLNNEKISALKKLGINRLSIGTQSFDDTTLKFLNRAHNSKEAIQSLEIASSIFDNLSIDLIYGIHTQSDEVFKKDLHQLLSFDPAHISAYSLTIEGNNAFSRWVEKGKLEDVEDEKSIRHFEVLMNSLEQMKYDHYEISNFSKPNFHSRHNSSYWFGTPYLGIGPSAHSFNGVSRQANISHNIKYMESIENAELNQIDEKLSKLDHINEYLMTRLRTKWGCDLKELKERYQYDLLEQQRTTINSYLLSNDIKISNDVLLLEKKGKILADQISSDLFLLS